MAWLQIVLALLTLAPKLLALISSAEEIVGSGNGALKKAMVMAPVEGIAPPTMLPALSGLIDKLVAAQNGKPIITPGNVGIAASGKTAEDPTKTV